MSKTVVNLTLPVINQEIEKVLDTYPDHPYQQAFANPDLRQRLIAYVLSQVDCKFTVTNGEEPEISPETLFPSSSDQTHVKQIIQQGVERLITEEGDWVSQHIPESAEDAEEDPSHWFG